MTYLFNSNTSATISNEVEIKNDVGNAIPIVGNVNSTVYNSTGKVTPQNPLPVTLGGANISIYGNTNIIDTVTVSSTPETPVHVHLTEIGTSGNIQSSYMPVQGNVNVTNTVNVTQGTTPWNVSGNVNVTPIIQSLGSAPFEWQIARNQIADAIPINIFGYNDSISTSPQAVWDVSTDYLFPETANVLTIHSSSSLDDTNTRILISGLDSNWNMLNESVTLNGTSNVTTSNSFLRVNQMIVTRVGAGHLGNEGTITARNNGNIYAQINPQISKTQMAVYSVPAGYTLYITQVTGLSGDAAGASKFMNFQCDIKNNVTGVNFILLRTTWQNIYQVQRVIPIAQTEKQDLKWQLYTGQGTYSGSIIVEGALIKN